MKVRTFSNIHAEHKQLGRRWRGTDHRWEETTPQNCPYVTYTEMEVTWDSLTRCLYLLNLDAMVDGKWLPLIEKGNINYENCKKVCK